MTAARRAWAVLPKSAKIALAAGGTGYVAYSGYKSWSSPEASPYSYGPVKVEASRPVTPTSKQITLRLTPALVDAIRTTPVPFHFDVKNTDLVVARSYTPVYVDLAAGTMTFLIKRYPVGETSKFMHRKNPEGKGDAKTVELCGPLNSFKLPKAPASSPDDSRKPTIGMIAGGTGITPFLQILESAFEEKPSKEAATVAMTWSAFSIVYAASSDEEHLAREKLAKLARLHPDRLSVRFMTDRTQFTQQLVRETMPNPSSGGLILVCGPEGFVRQFAGRKGRGLMSQGPLGGILAKMGYQAEEVYKF